MSGGSVAVAADGTVTKSGKAGEVYDQTVTTMAAKTPPVVAAGGPDGAAIKQSFADLANSVGPVIEGGSPTGAILMWPTASAPSGWLLCDASAVSRTTYATLFAVVSTAFGVGDGSTTFNVPDGRGRVVIGSGTGTASDATAHALASKAGTETVTLGTGEIPAHTHTVTDPGHFHEPTDASAGFLTSEAGAVYTVASGAGISLDSATGTATTGVTIASSGGSGGAHANMPPFITLNFIIKT